MKDILKRIAMFLFQSILGLCLFAMLVVVVADYTAGCGQTYIDSHGAVHTIAKNSECMFIKHHGKE